jgi:hypothetical protein
MKNRWMNLLAALCVLAALAAAQGKPAQNAAPDYSGRYSFLQEGEDVQLNVTDGQVSGYITRFGDGETDRGSVLWHLFAKASLAADKLTFTTKPVHAVWYEFSGKLGRGPAKSKAEDGYYEMTGTLTEHRQKDGKEESARQRQVTFKLFADEVEPSAK